MAYLGDTGQGATLVMTGLSLVSRVKSMQMPEWAMEKLDATGLGTSGFMEYVAGDVIDPGECTVELIFDPLDNIDSIMGDCGETCTIELPTSLCRETPSPNAATLAGTAIITNVQFPNLAINELMIVTLTIAFDGGTGPVWTNEN